MPLWRSIPCGQIASTGYTNLIRWHITAVQVAENEARGLISKVDRAINK
jgi:hypothetical protein